MLAFWIENWFLCSFFVANLTINSSSLLVIIFIRYHCLLTGVTILGKPRWQEISPKILDTGIYVASEGTRGIFPFRLEIQEFHSLWQPQWTKLAAFFMGHCIWCEENKTYILGIPVFFGYPVVLINQSVITTN